MGGSSLDDDFTVIPWEQLSRESTLGSGAAGVVFRGSYLGTGVAVKVLHKQATAGARAVAALMKEAALCVRLRHPHVLQTLGLASSPDGDYALVTELMVCSLDTVVDADATADPATGRRRLSWESPLLDVAADIAKGMRYLHQHSVLHRDLKPANVLCGPAPRYLAKVADFGESAELADKTMTLRGTPVYIAPEIVRTERYDSSADVYSYGACLVHMATRRIPFGSMTNMTSYLVMNGVATGVLNPVERAEGADWPPAIHKLAARCCRARVGERPTFDVIVPELADYQSGASSTEVGVALEESSSAGKRAKWASHCTFATVAEETSAACGFTCATAETSAPLGCGARSAANSEEASVGLEASSSSTFARALVVGSGRSWRASMRDSIRKMVQERGSRVSRTVSRMHSSL